MALSFLVLSLLPHVGGIPTIASFDKPVGIGIVVDQSYEFAWTDNDLDTTGEFSMFYQPSNLAPSAGIADVSGTAIAGAQNFFISEPDDTRVWDTSAVPAGSYYIYAVTNDLDPMYPQKYFGMSHGVVTVQHPGDPLFPAVTVTEPGAIAPPVGDAAAVRWEATGVGPLTARVLGKNRDEAGDLVEIVSDLPMRADGDRWKGCYVWNLSSKPNGYYIVKVEVVDAAGHTHASFPISNIALYRDPFPTDAGVAPSCAEPPGPADAGVTMDAGPTNGGDGGSSGCDVGHRRGGAPVGWIVGVALALVWTRRRRSGPSVRAS